jgi:hypothetical protein
MLLFSIFQSALTEDQIAGELYLYLTILLFVDSMWTMSDVDLSSEDREGHFND